MFRIINSFVHCLTINIIRITKNNHTTSTDWKEMAKKLKKHLIKPCKNCHKPHFKAKLQFYTNRCLKHIRKFVRISFFHSWTINNVNSTKIVIEPQNHKFINALVFNQRIAKNDQNMTSSKRSPNYFINKPSILRSFLDRILRKLTKRWFLAGKSQFLQKRAKTAKIREFHFRCIKKTETCTKNQKIPLNRFWDRSNGRTDLRTKAKP